MNSIMSQAISLMTCFLLLGVFAFGMQSILDSMGLGEYGRGVRIAGSLFICLMIVRNVYAMIDIFEKMSLGG